MQQAGLVQHEQMEDWLKSADTRTCPLGHRILHRRTEHSSGK